jgi:hypothetical protein
MIKKIFGVLFCLTIFSIPTLMSIPVYAATVISSTEGIVGTPVTISDLTNGVSYNIRWDDEVLKSGIVPSGGAISFYVPETPGGSHTVEVENPVGTSVFISAYNVVPSITISPNSGSIDTPVAVVGKGFSALESDIYVTYDSIVVAPSSNADQNGSWFAQFFTPASAGGLHYISAIGESTSIYNIERQAFTVSPRISINPVSGCVGTSVTVKGTGFVALESGIGITFDSRTVRSGIISQSDGTWTSTFNVPDSSNGPKIVEASGISTSSFNIPDSIFTVMASVFIDPDNGNIGDTINITGKGFEDDEDGIVITYDGQVLLKDIAANSEGDWTASVKIPASTSGIHDFGAYGSMTTTLNCAGTAVIIRPKITIDPDGGNVGDVISINGSGFNGQRPLTITFGDESVLFGAQTDSNGSFTSSLTIPEGRSGPIEIVVSDSTGQASGIFEVETIPPPVPQLLSPVNAGRVGFIGSSRVNFDWTDVSDPSGVYYTLEIALEPDFLSPLFIFSDLDSSQYSLSDSEALPHGKYYWRIRAIDGASNASTWTEPFLVKVSVLTVEMFILIVAVVVILIVLVLLLIIKLRRGKRKAFVSG